MPEHARGAEAEEGTLTGSVAAARAVTGGMCSFQPVQFKERMLWAPPRERELERAIKRCYLPFKSFDVAARQ